MRYAFVGTGSTLVIAAAMLAGGPAFAGADDRTIDIQSGTIQGRTEGQLATFKGIPFAKPPVGPLRWQAPVTISELAATPWDATEYANHCPQENNKSDAQASEDCLYLNVFTPAEALADEGARPVMVWIYGGANANGAGDFYDPSQLVTQGDVTIVTLNYRIGALGLLAHPDIQADETSPVNLGVLDQRLALKWVQDNIAHFGGDPSNVTLFGESAGALNVTAHLASADSWPYFNKAIIQSGGYLLETPSLADARERGIAFAERLGCSDEDAGACLLAKSTTEILEAQGVVNTDSAAYFQMVVDGSVVERPLSESLYSGAFHRVPLIIGTNAQEGNLFFNVETKEAAFESTLVQFSEKNHRLPEWTRALYAVDDNNTPMSAASGVLGDSEFSCPGLRSAFWTSLYTSTYFYEFADDDSLNSSAHFADIHYLFKFRGQETLGLHGPERSQALAKSMIGYWSGFAYAGSPQGDGLPAWTAFGPADQDVMLLAANGLEQRPTLASEGFIETHNCHFWGIR